MLKKVGKVILAFLCILFLSFLVECFLFQGRFIFGGHVDNELINVTDYSLKEVLEDDGKTSSVVSINFGGEYVLLWC